MHGCTSDPVYGADATAYSTLDGILNKTIVYENQTDIAWRNNVLLPMAISNFANEKGEGLPRCDGHELGEYIKSDLAAPQGFGSYTMYEQEGLTPVTASCDAALTSTNLRNRWGTNPYGIVDWWGHGSSTAAYRKYWDSDTNGDGIPQSGELSSPSFFTSYDTSYLNDNYPSVVVQVSCTNGYPEESGNLGYTLLKRGAIRTSPAPVLPGTRLPVGTRTRASYGDNASYAIMPPSGWPRTRQRRAWPRRSMVP